MANEITSAQSFEERMKDRIRKDIGSLMTDEELRAIVSRAVEEVFFKPKQVPSTYHTKQEPPMIHMIVRELLETQVRRSVDAWMVEHRDTVEQALQKMLLEGAGFALINALNSKFEVDLYNFQTSLQSKLGI